MTVPLRLVVFDVDGTLVDSQADIVGGMTTAFRALDLPVPDRSEILSAVGLSLPEFMQQVVPDVSRATHGLLIDAYKAEYAVRRARAAQGEGSPLYPGILTVLKRLHARDEVLLGVATGKSRRGLDMMLDAHALRPLVVTQQCADDHPSKPHPAMLEQALSETGLEPSAAVMVGDTSFDIEMGGAAGMATVGVAWGYHSVDRLAGASVIAQTVADLEDCIDMALGGIC